LGRGLGAADSGQKSRCLNMDPHDSLQPGDRQTRWRVRLRDGSTTCGISELLWISKGSFLVLERNSFAGREAKIKRVYLAKLGTATDVTSLESLASAKGSFQTMEKKLVLDLLNPKLGLTGDNFPPK
jgi:hypothetical protein